MLKFHGHTFTDAATCACCDVKSAKRVVLVDPTNTGKLRNQFRSQLRLHWNQMRELVKLMIVQRDILALKSMGLTALTAPALTGAGSKIDVFQRWLDMALSNVVLQKDGSFMRKYLTEAYTAGTTFAQQQAQSQAVHVMSGHRQDALVTLARIELEGIVEAVSQQSLRAVSEGILSSAKPMAIARRVLNIIEKVGVNRSFAMVELLTVRAHAEASLDAYEAAGLTEVGLLPEARAKAVTDEKAQQETKGRKAGTQALRDAPRKTGPGSKVPRSKLPSARTLSRIRSAERRIASSLGSNVNVRTAGDDDVCPKCKAIAKLGPYSINVARSLIPAHPHCRCVFVPVRGTRGARESLDDE